MRFCRFLGERLGLSVLLKSSARSTSTEDDILQSIELGNVAMPLNSQLIRGSQSLFGVKTELQFGKTRVTAVIAEQQSEQNTVRA